MRCHTARIVAYQRSLLTPPPEDTDEEMWEGSRTSAEEKAGNTNENL